MIAEQLIDKYLNEKLVPADSLSGKDIAKLKGRENIYVNGRRAVVVSVSTKGNTVELIYVKGRKVFGKEQYLDISLNATTTPVQSSKEVYEGHTVTQGMRRAYEKHGGVKCCKECELLVPKYPGRYPNKCPSCGAELEDLQNSPKYSEEATARDLIQLAQLNIRYDPQMRRIPKDRLPLGGPEYYEL